MIVAEEDDVSDTPDALALTDELDDTDGDALPVELTLPLEEIVDVPHDDAEPLIDTEGDSVVEEEEEIDTKLAVEP